MAMAVDLGPARSYNETHPYNVQRGRESSRMGLTILLIFGLLILPGRIVPSSRQVDVLSFRTKYLEGTTLRHQGEYESSHRVLEKALVIANRDRNLIAQGRCLLFMGLAKWDMGEFSAAATCFSKAERAFEEGREVKAREFCAKCLDVVRFYNLGKGDRIAGLLHRSISRFDEARKLCRDLGLPDLEMKCLRQQALAHLDLRQFGSYFENNRLALQIAQEIRHGIEQARCLNNIGVYYLWHSDFTRALAHFEKSLAVLENVEDQGTEAECNNNLGLIFKELGNYERAHFYLSRAIEIDRRSKDYQAIARDLANIGSVILLRGINEHHREDLSAALQYFQDCLALRSLVAIRPLVIYAVLNNMGLAFNELKDYNKARKYYRWALAIPGNKGKDPAKRQVLSNLAASYLAEEDIPSALKYYRGALQSGERDSFSSSELESIAGLGLCYEKLGDDQSALSYYRRAIELTENMRERIPNSEVELIGFARTKILPYERSIHILSNRYRKCPTAETLDEIFSVIERARARAFLDSLNAARAVIPKADRIFLDDRLQNLALDIDRLTVALVNPGISPVMKAAIQEELEIDENDYVRIIQQVKVTHLALDGPWRVTLNRMETIRELLALRNALLLEYYIGEEESCLLSVSGRSATFRTLPPRRDIERMLRPYLKSISDLSVARETTLSAAARITSALIPHEETELINTIVIVPDGILHYLPFETLVAEAASPPEYLVQRFALSYCPSASALAALLKPEIQQLAPPRKMLLAIGGSSSVPKASLELRAAMGGPPAGPAFDFEEGSGFTPLPFSRKEILDIAKEFPTKLVDTLVGDEANETAVKTLQLENYRIIHFACHSFLNERYPFRSALVLSPSDNSEDDGFLQMREIYGLRLNADLVVLSACQSGKGFLEECEGTLDLARPFFYAGAHSVMASLWSIDDKATRALMSEFYRALSMGVPVENALMLAKRVMLKSPWAHPFYWAGFLMHGISSLPPASSSSSPGH